MRFQDIISRISVPLMLFALIVYGVPGYSQDSPTNQSKLNDVLVRKNFPLVTHIEDNRKLQKLIRKDKFLSALAVRKNGAAKNALTCSDTPECYAQALKFSPEEQAEISDELVKLLGSQKSFKKFAAELRHEAGYALYDSLPDTVLLRKATADLLRGLNQMVDVYLLGIKPRYPKIDSISFTQGDVKFYNKVRDSIEVVAARNGQYFFETPLNTALALLKINGRDEAARYEPLWKGMNEAPYNKIATTNWRDYKYSLILVPGLGPETPGVELDPGAVSRIKDAVERFRQGAAPFLVVSGGNVHPFKTPFNEAVEMKKYMVEQLQIPADVIFIEPHARHTTTNLRNTNRMVYNFNIPSEKPILIVTDASQTSYISGNMEKTAIRDLQYLPYSRMKKLSDKETEYYPNRSSLHADPFDPLDP